METTIICWAKTANDSRDTASSIASYKVAKKCRSVAAIARAIDENGQDEIDRQIRSGNLIENVYSAEKHHVAPGFGVTIQYGNYSDPKKRLRTIRA